MGRGVSREKEDTQAHTHRQGLALGNTDREGTTPWQSAYCVPSTMPGPSLPSLSTSPLRKAQ